MGPEHKPMPFFSSERYQPSELDVNRCQLVPFLSDDFEPFEVSFISPDPQATGRILLMSHHLITGV